jgi:hypothetical protein
MFGYNSSLELSILHQVTDALDFGYLQVLTMAA